MTTLDNFIGWMWQKKAPAQEDEWPNIFNDKGTNNSIYLQEFDEFCEKEYNRIVAEDDQVCEWVTATQTPSSAMARELAPVTEYETQHAAPMPIDNSEHTRKKKSLRALSKLVLVAV